MSSLNSMCVVFSALLICFVWCKTDALVINYYDALNGSSIMEMVHPRNYKRDLPAGFTDYGVGAYKFHKEPLTWGKARKVCEAEGAYLAIINSQLEEEVLMAIFVKFPAAEIKGSAFPDFVSVGVHDYFDEGDYLTVHGKPLESTGFVHWGAAQPGGGIKENVVVMHRTGVLHDAIGTHLWAFVCEFDTSV